jgi:XTP/dITP diphosphohydrolase
LPEPDEPEPTFAGNARRKALAAARRSGMPAIADDSGLCVDALGDQPGVLSARWAGPAKDFALAMRKVAEALAAQGADTPERRRARFVAALALAWPDGHVEAFQGEVAGTLVWPPRGERGFGYDPMFLPDDRAQTFGEMPAEEKHRISHRARAFRMLIDACLGAG